MPSMSHPSHISSEHAAEHVLSDTTFSALREADARALGAPDWLMLVAGLCTSLNMTNIMSSFPINVNLDKNKETDCWEVEIRNFIGEKLVRRVVMRPGVEVEASKNQKDQLELSGNVRTAAQHGLKQC